MDDTHVEAQVAPLTPGTDDTTDDDVRVIEAHPGKQVVKDAAVGALVGEKELGAEQQYESAAQYLLDAFTGSESEVAHTLELNVGGRVGSGDEKWIRWTVRSLPGGLIRKIRQDAAEVSARKGATAMLVGDPETNFMANVKIVVEGSVNPNVKQVAIAAGLPAPHEFLKVALANKQGLIDRLAGQILSISGWDDDDIRDAEKEVAAAVPSS